MKRSLVATVALLALALAVTPVLAQSLHGGTWTKRSFDTAGTWRIVERDGARWFVLGPEFKTRKAPDLKLLLVPRDVGSITPENVLDGAFRVVQLGEFKGRQEFRIPDDVDLSKYRSVALHCEKYTKLWSVAPLR